MFSALWLLVAAQIGAPLLIESLIHVPLVGWGGRSAGCNRSKKISAVAVTSHSINPSLVDFDPEVESIFQKEWKRQYEGIELIASENFVSSNVIRALGSCMTNKYSEGQPQARYYGGNQYVDELEILCQERALDLFGLSSAQWAVNVQPYSGSPANFAVYTALLKPHDRIMGLDLPSGGHLTHGYQTAKRKVSATSIFFESLPYRVHPDTGLVDYDEMEKLTLLFKPKLLIAGASAYPRDWDYARMRRIADSVGAYFMADIAHISGLVATRQCHNPFDYCDVVTSTTHKTLRGPRSGMIFCKVELKDSINNAVFPALQGGPHNHQIAALAVALKEASLPAFTDYIAQVKLNAVALAEALQQHGYVLVTEGTENHLVLWDLRPTGLSGGKMEKLLEMVHISTNKNSLASDASAVSPSGLRLGTPAMTTRGMGEGDMRRIADFLHRAVVLGRNVCGGVGVNGNSGSLKLKDFVQGLHGEAYKDEVRVLGDDVKAFASIFPMPGFAYLPN
ncbi:serine hydroxymethyltransferase [archaeon]|nr:MAG: serine hydroxymethyltransferase [archaeon]